MIILFALVIGVVLCAVVGGTAYTAGRNRASEYDKMKKAEYKEMSERVTKMGSDLISVASEKDTYEYALRDISAGRGGVPELTAQAALSLFKNK